MSENNNKSSMLVSSAILLQQAGYNSKSIDILQLAIQEDPENIQAYVLLGALSQAVGDAKAAEKYYRKALSLNFNDSEALQGFALFLNSQERFSESVPYFELHRKNNAKNILSLGGLIEAYANLPETKGNLNKIILELWGETGNKELAAEYIRHLISVGDDRKISKIISAIIEIPENPRILQRIASSFFENNDCKNSRLLLEKAISIDPLFSEGWLDLSNVWSKLGNQTKSMDAIEKAIQISPSNDDYKFNKICKFHEFKDYNAFLVNSGLEIEGKINSSQDINDFQLLVYRLLRVHSYQELGCTDDLISEVTAAKKEFPEVTFFYTYPIDYLLRQNLPNKALKILKNPPNSEVRNALRSSKYKILHYMDKSDEAWKTIQPLLRNLKQEDFQQLVSVGVSFVEEGSLDQALIVFQQLKSLQPEDARLTYYIGYSLIGSGKIAEGQKVLVSILDRPGKELYKEAAKLNLAYLYNMEGDYYKALSLIENVIASGFEEGTFLFRVNCWKDNSMKDDPKSLTGRRLSFEEAAYATAISSALAIGDLDKAEEYFTKLVESSDSKDLLEMITESIEEARKKE